MKHFSWIAVLLALLLVACASQPSGSVSVGDIRISGAWSRAATAMGGDGGGNGAAYMIIENTGQEADRLVKAESDMAMVVEIHKTEMKDDVMTMSPVDGLDIPAQGSVELKPGSFHVMMMGLKSDLKEGDRVHLKFTFEKAGSIELDAVVRKP